MESLIHFLELLWGTVFYRPYVYAFFVCFLGFAGYHLRLKGTFAYILLAYLIAFICEYSSTRNGFPFGMYVYIDEMRTRELWLSNIPFWDSLSFVFLSYFSWIVAASVRMPSAPSSVIFEKRTALLSGMLMMLLDVVIDPLTLLGDRWFLGKIYYYPQGGTYFGVTLSNFCGWFFVGTFTVLMFQFLSQTGWLERKNWRPISKWLSWGAFGVYGGVFIFNMCLTAWIKEWELLASSCIVILTTLIPSGRALSRA